MFPDVRLMIGAIMASIVTLGCGFGVFAAFRVNHEPLARLSNVSAPVSLVADSAAPRVAPFPGGQARGSRFEMNDGGITGSIAGAAAPIRPQSPDAERPQLAAAGAAVPAPAQAPLTVAPAPSTDTMAAAPTPTAPPGPGAAAVGTRPDQAAAPEQAAVEPRNEPSVEPRVEPAVVAVASPEPAPSAPDTARSEPTNTETADQASAKPQTTSQAAPSQAAPSQAAKPDQGPPEASRPAQEGHAAIQASQAPKEKLDQESNVAIIATDAAPVDDDAAAPAHDSAGPERRVSGVARRGRRPRIAAVAPSNVYNSSFPQTNYPSTQSGFQATRSTPPSVQATQSTVSFFGSQTPSPVPRRVVHRVAAKPAPAGVGGPFVAPPVPPVR